ETVYLMMSHYLRPLEEVDAVAEAHRAFLARLQEDGLLIEGGRLDPPVGGVVLLRVATREEAVATMAADPYVTEQVASYDAFGWKPRWGVLAGGGGKGGWPWAGEETGGEGWQSGLGEADRAGRPCGV